MMEYEKATVDKIELNEEDIITTSGCQDSNHAAADKCGDQSHYEKYVNCTNQGHMYHGGQ